MLKKLLCFLLGHRLVTSKYYTYADWSGYKYERSPFCLRCGRKIDE